MPVYRKKPVEIEAFQFQYKEKNRAGFYPKWFLEAAMQGIIEESDDGDRVLIKTLEGMMEVSDNDYIIRGIKGEIYPCKPDIFEMSYDRV